MKIIRSFLTAASVALVAATASAQYGNFRDWAPTPPRGWNSWDCYYSSVTEKEVMQNAKWQHDNLLDYGWEYVVVDIRWYCDHPSLGAGWYNQKGTQAYVLDQYGRYLPSVKRFPSALKDGKNIGFKAMADSIHAMGMKFGIHIMRGVPTEVAKNPSKYTLLGSNAINPWSKVASGTTSPCTWLADNALVQETAEGQLYYDSIIKLYAEWGVDFIKVDDISRPFYTGEISMIRKAIDKCGRPIVLSLSPGKTQYIYAENCLNLANQWRMMDDLWDNWSHVRAVFNEAYAWQNVTRPGNFADCDMLPLGQIAMTVADPGFCNADAGRWTKLTRDEQTTMMTLWGVCHSPLFFGGEMTRNDAFTKSLLTNRDMLDMNAYGVDAHRVSDNGAGQIVWTSLNPANGNRWLALFQSDDTRWVDDKLALFKSETVAYTTDGHAVDVDIAWPDGCKSLYLAVDDGGDNNNYDHGDWLNPTLVLRDGSEVELTGKYLTSTYTKSYFNRVYENKNVDHGGKMKVMDVTYDRGFSTDANAMLTFTIPDNMDVVRFKAKAAADDSGIGQNNSTTSLCFMVFGENPRPGRSGLISRKTQKSCNMEINVTGASELKITVDNYDGSFAYDRADLINPVLVDSAGVETSLTKLSHQSYTSEWGTLHINRNVEGGPLRVDGVTYDTGLGMNAKCTLVYKLPENHKYVKLKALCGYDSSCDTDNKDPNSGTTMEFGFDADCKQPIVVNLADLGYDAGQSVSVYDCWALNSLGTLSGTISQTVPSHGAKLLRLVPERTDGSSVSLTHADGYAVATVTGNFDSTSYVQFEIDGKRMPAVKYDGSPVKYAVSGGCTVKAYYSGTQRTNGAVSEPLTVPSGLTDVVADRRDGKVYNIQGQRLGSEPQHGYYIKNGKVFRK